MTDNGSTPQPNNSTQGNLNGADTDKNSNVVLNSNVTTSKPKNLDDVNADVIKNVLKQHVLQEVEGNQLSSDGEEPGKDNDKKDGDGDGDEFDDYDDYDDNENGTESNQNNQQSSGVDIKQSAEDSGAKKQDKTGVQNDSEEAYSDDDFD